RWCAEARWVRFARACLLSSQARMSSGGAVAAVAARGLRQAGFVERRHLDQFGQLDLLHQQLRNAITAMHRDRRAPVEVDQRHLDLAAVARVDGSWTV